MNSSKDSILKNSLRDPDTGCLRWQGGHNQKGYGTIRHDGKTIGVHRVAYQLWIGEIPEGLQIDHVHANGCRYRDCVNYKHLEAVTVEENNFRRRNPPLPAKCINGHDYDSANTLVRFEKNGHRVLRCKTCYSNVQRTWASQRKQCSNCGSVVRTGGMSRHKREVCNTHEGAQQHG